MDSNERKAATRAPYASLSRATALIVALTTAAWLVGCSVTGSRESPLRKVTEGSATVVDVYRGRTQGGAQAPAARESAQDLLRRESAARPIAQGDGDSNRYWSALEPMRQRFARVPNPDLVMVVYPHLARGQYPVPGYVTVFPMYEQAQYALPGEVDEDLLSSRRTR